MDKVNYNRKRVEKPIPKTETMTLSTLEQKQGKDYPTITSVAKAAGVSKSTVSKVLNRQLGVSSKTRKKVLRVIDQFGYTPSIVAKSLKNKKTKAVGVILPNIINPFFAAMLRGIEDSAIRKGYVVVFCDSDDTREKESLYFQIFENRWVDGIIFSGTATDAEEEAHIRKIQNKGIPVVLVDREIEAYFTNVVMVDNVRAAFEATTYLLDLGHRKIGHIAGPQEIKVFAKRLQGYKEALARCGVSVDLQLVRKGDLSIRSGESAARELMMKKVPVTALFCGNDLMAIGAMKEFQRNGLKIPQDVCLMGFDDIPLASLVSPSLSTVAQPSYQIGTTAIDLLVKSIEERSIDNKVILPTKLILRESTKR